MTKKKLNPLLARKIAIGQKIEAGGQLTQEEIHFLTYGTLDFDTYSGEQLVEWFLDEKETGAFKLQSGLNKLDYADVIVRIAEEGAFSFFAMVRENWVMMDDFHHATEELRSLFNKEFSETGAICIPEESRDWWGKQPETLKVYRGCEADRWDGLSWTLDRKVATSFAKGHVRKLNKPIIASATIPKSLVMFCTNQRKEAEVVWDVKSEAWKGEIKKMPYKGKS